MAKNTSKDKPLKGQEKTQEIQKVSPTRMLSPFDEMDRLFDGFFPRHWMHRFGWERPGWSEMMMPFEGRTPKVDVVERDEDILVRAEIPGVEKNDLDVSLSNNTVTIKGSTRHEEKEEKGDYYRSEISTGAFSRTLGLPCDVDSDKARAKFRNGVLELTLPKVEASQRRSITIEE